MLVEKNLISDFSLFIVYKILKMLIILLLEILHMNYVSNRANFLLLLDIMFADVKMIVI